MKKIYSLLLITIFSFAYSQIHLGVKGGYNLSDLKWKMDSGSNDVKFDSKSYFYIGGFIEFKITDKFSLQEEISYTEIGGKLVSDVLEYNGEAWVKIANNEYNYRYPQIQNSILAKYYPIQKLAVIGGLNLGININPNIKTSYQYYFEGTDDGKLENVNIINVFPFVGTEFHITSKLFADARYHFGINNMHDNDYFKVKSNFLQIGLGYRFK